MQAFSDRGGSAKKEVGMEDIMLAIQAKATTSFASPPSQDVSAPVTTVFAVSGFWMCSGKVGFAKMRSSAHHGLHSAPCQITRHTQSQPLLSGQMIVRMLSPYSSAC